MNILTNYRDQVLYIEGMDCSGKSTVVKELLAQVDSKNMKHRHRFLSLNENPYIETFHELKKSEIRDSDKIADALIEAINYDIAHYDANEKKDEIVLQESTLLIKGMAIRMEESNSRNQIIPFYEALHQHPKFRSIVLTANKESRQERLMKRKKQGGQLSENDLMILDDYNRFERIEKNMIHLMKMYFNAAVIDTSYISAKKVSAIIAKNMIHVVDYNFHKERKKESILRCERERERA